MKSVLRFLSYVSWFDLALNCISLALFVIFSDRFAYKIQTFGLVYMYILLGLIVLTGLCSSAFFISTRLSMILGFLMLIPSLINILFALAVSSD